MIETSETQQTEETEMTTTTLQNKIVRVNWSDLKPNYPQYREDNGVPFNPRTITPEAIEKMKADLLRVAGDGKTVTLLEPWIVCGDIVLNGNTRLLTLLEMANDTESGYVLPEQVQVIQVSKDVATDPVKMLDVVYIVNTSQQSLAPLDRFAAIIEQYYILEKANLEAGQSDNKAGSNAIKLLEKKFDVSANAIRQARTFFSSGFPEVLRERTEEGKISGLFQAVMLQSMVTTLAEEGISLTFEDAFNLCYDAAQARNAEVVTEKDIDEVKSHLRRENKLQKEAQALIEETPELGSYLNDGVLDVPTAKELIKQSEETSIPLAELLNTVELDVIEASGGSEAPTITKEDIKRGVKKNQKQKQDATLQDPQQMNAQVETFIEYFQAKLVSAEMDELASIYTGLLKTWNAIQSIEKRKQKEAEKLAKAEAKAEAEAQAEAESV